MKKIKDERLVLKNLQNIRIAYIVQTIGILAILGYDLVTKGIEGMTANPLWIVFMLTAVVSAYLSMSISVDHEESDKSPKKGFVLSVIIAVLIALVVGILTALTDGFGPMNGIVIGGIIFICFLAPTVYIYFLRKKRQE